MEEKRRTIAREIISRRAVGSVLREHEVTASEFTEWLEDGELPEYIRCMARYSAMAECPEVWQRLKEMADDGDPRAIKLYIELCDKVGSHTAESGGVVSVRPEIKEARRDIFGNE